MAKRKIKEWKCSKGANNEIQCESKRGNAVSMSSNGSVRFTKFDCDTPVRIDGKKTKDKCGVELN